MQPVVYKFLPSPGLISALQSRSSSQVKVYKQGNDYILDEEHMPELIKPQLHFITSISDIYVDEILIPDGVVRLIANSHPDVYIIVGDAVYIDPLTYDMNDISHYTQELLSLAYRYQTGKENNPR